MNVNPFYHSFTAKQDRRVRSHLSETEALVDLSIHRCKAFNSVKNNQWKQSNAQGYLSPHHGNFPSATPGGCTVKTI